MSWDLFFKIVFLLGIFVGITTVSIKHKISLIHILLYTNFILFTLVCFFNFYVINIIIFIITIFIAVLFIIEIFKSK